MSFPHGAVNHLRGRKAHLRRSRIQTATQREGLLLPRVRSDVLPIDADGGRTAKAEFFCHLLAGDKYLEDVRRYPFRGQDIFYQLDGREMRRTLRNVQHFHFTFSGLRVTDSDRSGQRAVRLRSSFLQAWRALRSSCSSLWRSASLPRTCESFCSRRRRTGAQGWKRRRRSPKSCRTSFSVNPRFWTRRMNSRVCRSVSAYWRKPPGVRGGRGRRALRS